jgi:SET domain-containing protein
VNHLPEGFNLKASVYPFNGQPRLILSACKEIQAGEQLFFDYGDRDEAYPWLSESMCYLYIHNIHREQLTYCFK